MHLAILPRPSSLISPLCGPSNRDKNPLAPSRERPSCLTDEVHFGFSALVLGGRFVDFAGRLVRPVSTPAMPSATAQFLRSGLLRIGKPKRMLWIAGGLLGD